MILILANAKSKLPKVGFRLTLKKLHQRPDDTNVHKGPYKLLDIISTMDFLTQCSCSCPRRYKENGNVWIIGSSRVKKKHKMANRHKPLY